MSEHSHISAIFDSAFQSRAGSPDVYMSMVCVVIVISGMSFRCSDCTDIR